MGPNLEGAKFFIKTPEGESVEIKGVQDVNIVSVQVVDSDFDFSREIRVLVQKLKDNCNESIDLGHIVTITLKRVRDWYGKGKCIQMEALSA
ncbi:PadR family transcriptional regulator [Bacillus nitratireducens]|uniref:PadR family transcriptional regulator n=1 Tax=Bacillus nitratireducens TaxID=2026193 RepID=UPI003D302750